MSRSVFPVRQLVSPDSFYVPIHLVLPSHSLFVSFFSVQESVKLLVSLFIGVSWTDSAVLWIDSSTVLRLSPSQYPPRMFVHLAFEHLVFIDSVFLQCLYHTVLNFSLVYLVAMFFYVKAEVYSFCLLLHEERGKCKALGNGLRIGPDVFAAVRELEVELTEASSLRMKI